MNLNIKEAEVLPKETGIEVLADYAAWQFPLKGELIETRAYFARCENCDKPGCKGCIGCDASCSAVGLESEKFWAS